MSISLLGGVPHPDVTSRLAENRTAGRHDRSISRLSIASMKAVAPYDRPREKLARLGASGLGDNELIALLIGSGSGELDALGVANELIERAGGVHALTRLGLDHLRTVRGVGPVRAARVIAAVELGRRTLVRSAVDRPRLTTPRQLAAYLLPQYGSG